METTEIKIAKASTIEIFRTLVLKLSKLSKTLVLELSTKAKPQMANFFQGGTSSILRYA